MAESVVCCSDGSDFESDTVHQPTKRVAAQGSSVAPTAISSLKRSKQENVVWKLKLENAKEKIKSLENERDFLRNQLSEALALANKEDQVTAAPSLHEKSIEKSSSSSTSSSSSSDSSSSSSSSSSERGKKKKKRNNSNNKKDSKKKKGKKGNKKNTKIGKRVLTPEESMDRYRRVLVAVKKGMTKTEAYVKVGVDRKTVAATAAISELHAVDKDLPLFTESVHNNLFSTSVHNSLFTVSVHNSLFTVSVHSEERRTPLVGFTSTNLQNIADVYSIKNKPP
ncbi:unnamed protein product [Gadus morhua 'NCC']